MKGVDEESGALDGDNPKDQKSKWQRAKDKRVLEKGLPFIPFTLCAMLWLTLFLLAVTYPTMYMGFGPLLCQKAVDHTYISLYNLTVDDWAFVSKDATNSCEKYFPEYMSVYQNIRFDYLPWYVQLGPLSIQPSQLEVLYNGTQFGILYQPELDLTDPSGNTKWANGTLGRLVVTNKLQFLEANANLLPFGQLVTGWAMWTQKGDVIIKYKLLGVTQYYHAHMQQDVNITDPKFISGPMVNINDNLFDMLLCLPQKDTGESTDTTTTSDATTTTA